MLKEERHQYILNRINQNYRIYITALSSELGVSDDTLRRDLAELDELGLLTKVHGGAIARSGIPVEFTDRLNTGIAGKQQMATKVIPLFSPGDIVNVLMHHPNLELIFLGGKVFPSSQVTVGVSVFQALQTIRPDWLVLGISNVHPHQGLTGPDREEAMMKRLMMERAQKRIILADSHKLNTAEAYSVASLGDIDYLVTEDSKVDYIRQNWPKSSYQVL